MFSSEWFPLAELIKAILARFCRYRLSEWIESKPKVPIELYF